MNDIDKTVIVAMIAVIVTVGVCWMISSTLQPELIEPHGPMTGGDENTDPMMMPSAEAIPWDEMIYVPVYPECEGEEMILIDEPTKIEYANGTTIWHWLYTCQIAEMNR